MHTVVAVMHHALKEAFMTHNTLRILTSSKS